MIEKICLSGYKPGVIRLKNSRPIIMGRTFCVQRQSLQGLFFHGNARS